MDQSSSILVTGTAGFIGFHVAKRLLNEGFNVIGVDSMNDYYDVTLKQKRTEILEDFDDFTFYKLDLTKYDELKVVFDNHHVEKVINLAAQAGVRYSLTNPHVYLDSNITSFLNILEGCRHSGVKHLVYASSSSVYGANTSMPMSVNDSLSHPLSLYAATKKSNELMAHTYSSCFNLPVTGLRFFTVYGPWGRPDMALFIFTKSILNDEPIDVFNNGNMKRDFTYVDDIVEGVVRVLDHIPQPNDNWDSDHPDPSTSFAPYQLFNIGNNSPVDLMDFIHALENELGKKAKINFMPLQTGDVPVSYADATSLKNAVGYQPNTKITDGVKKFVDWYRDYYGE